LTDFRIPKFQKQSEIEEKVDKLEKICRKYRRVEKEPPKTKQYYFDGYLHLGSESKHWGQNRHFARFATIFMLFR